MNLDRFFIQKSYVEMIPPDEQAIASGERVEKLPFSSQISYSVGRNMDNELNYRLSFALKIWPKQYGWNIEMAVDGFFTFPEGTPSEQREQMIRVGGCSILYGILRGHISSVTGAFPNGPFRLPTVNMIEVVREIEESIQSK